MQAFATYVLAVAAYTHAAHALFGLFRLLRSLMQPSCGMWLAKTGREHILFCGGHRAFANAPCACPSLTTGEHVGLRFDPRWSRPETIAGKEDKEKRKETKKGNEKGEPRHGAKIGNEKREPR